MRIFFNRSNIITASPDDQRLVRTYEFLNIIKDIINGIGNKSISILEFSTLTYLLQCMSNNVIALSKNYTLRSEFSNISKLLFTKDGAWVKGDRLSLTHILNLKQFYEQNK